MTEQKQVYKCNICGNIVEVNHAGAGELVCCGQPMELLNEKTEDAGQEKHTPIIEKTEQGVKVKVGSIPHPMEEKALKIPPGALLLQKQGKASNLIKVDKIKGKSFLKTLIEAYNSGLLGSRIHKKFNLPKNAKSKEEKARYYFYVISVDYGVKAKRLFEKMRKLHEEDKDLFNPEFVSKMSIVNLEKLMRKLGMRFPVQAAQRWRENSKKLVEEYNAKALGIFQGNTEEIIKKIKEFNGFGDKLSRLLLRTVVDAGVIKKPVGFEEMSLPTDIHVVKLAFRSGLLSGEKPNYSKHVKKAREAWTGISLEEKKIPADVDRALWVLGAEYCSKKRCKECPLKNKCMDKVIQQ